MAASAGHAVAYMIRSICKHIVHLIEILYLLTYLIGHNNQINGFRPAPSRRSILLHTNDMAEPAQPLDINTLHNVHVVEELIQLTIELNAEINANSHWAEDLT